MDLSQWETSSLVDIHRACTGSWRGYLRDFTNQEDNQEIVTIEVDSHGVYSKMK